MWPYWDSPVAKDAPYIHVRWTADGIVKLGGASSARFGHVDTQAQPGTDADPFACWQYDHSQLVLRNDRYGFYPLFYSRSGDGALIISPSPLKLLAVGVPSDLDYAAIGLLLRIGFLVGEYTPFRHIRVLPPSCRLQWVNGQPVIRGEYAVQKCANITREQAIDGYVELFRAAVRRRPPRGQCFVPLSGGRDSRHILLELSTSGWRPCAVTVDDPALLSDDVATAAQLATAIGAKHEVITVDQYVRNEAIKNGLTHFCTSEHAWLVPLRRHLSRVPSAVYEGVGGDTLSTCWHNSPGLEKSLFQRMDFENIARELLWGTDGWLPKCLSTSVYKQMPLETSVALLVEELTKHASAPYFFGSFVFWNRTRRVTALSPTCILSVGEPVWCPYLDYDLANFLMSLPAGILLDDEYHRFHTDAIRRAYPQYADIPFAGKNASRHLGSRTAQFTCLWEFLVFLSRHRPSSVLVRPSFLYPRLLKAICSPSYADTQMTRLVTLTEYLLQLEQVIQGWPGEVHDDSRPARNGHQVHAKIVT